MQPGAAGGLPRPDACKPARSSATDGDARVPNTPRAHPDTPTGADDMHCSRPGPSPVSGSAPDAPNAQYNLARAGSLSIRVATRMRAQMFARFMQALHPTEADTVIDVGVTSDQSYASSNYFERLYPHKHRITACGLDDAHFLEALYPGVRFVTANALDLPFDDRSFDLVHASAVLEHVGSLTNQSRMLAECLRVARRGVFLTTPNRWYPIEFHTQMPLVHWLPKPAGRAIFRALGLSFFAREENLNLMTRGELAGLAAVHPDWQFRFISPRLLGWVSNLVLLGERRAATPSTLIPRPLLGKLPSGD